MADSSRVLTVWRLVTARFARSAFTGDGARRYGGRWNRKGIPLVYTSGTQSLAMLEMLVQDDPLRARYVIIPATIPNLLNPLHPAFAKIEIGEPQTFLTDLRLIKK